ncbi:methyltransferase domain-containing protein [Xanthomonas axonopodis pv. ricini]|uniref:methyltransferase domain-containing protein n=1 Tax=Xanthomonas euvesicatoria TaxID=456327 RepID=UPI00245825ED|nr:methyltransferase domain-containing protein [Xanthomonas euvesicatoria]MDH4909013.1 class I SAM-dependent methyltransferase [Xanthomonas euvesicatoria]
MEIDAPNPNNHFRIEDSIFSTKRRGISMDRIAWLTQGITPEDCGLEIGPLDRPIVPRQGHAIRYADHLDRNGLIHKYSEHVGVNPENIPDIDFVIGKDGLLSAVGEHRFRYFVASHVIEHVPNPIGWLNDIHDLLEDGGWAALAIPDHRQCFDALRSLSTAGDWVEATLMNHSRPSPSRIFDALSNEVTVDGAISWNHHPAIEEMRLSRSPRRALDIARHVLASGEYFDVHCWTFTPESFCNLMRTVVAADLVKLHLMDITPPRDNEFLVQLGRNDSMSQLDRRASYPASGERFRSLPDGFRAADYYRLNPDVAAATVDANDHYVEYGANEGRVWR